jgi:hypothetical protein
VRLRAICLLLVGAGSLDPTQATLEISTNAVCGAEGPTDGTFFEAGVLAAAAVSGLPDAPNGTTCACTPGPDGVHDVGTMIVFPEGGATSATAVVIGSLDSVTAEQCVPFAKGDLGSPVRDRCIVARRAITFADHRPLTVPILLDSQCAGVPCPDSQTCARTATGVACVDASVICEGATCTVSEGGGGGGGPAPEIVYDGSIEARAITGLGAGAGARP